MIIAHLPAGYITVSLLSRRLCKHPVRPGALMFWGVFGSIAPDLDFAFCLIAHHQVLCDHHLFPTHYPSVWLSLLSVSMLWMLYDRQRSQGPTLAAIFFLSCFIHMILDAITSHIFWLAPFSYVQQPASLAEYGFWQPAYIELLIVLWALGLWQKERLLRILSKV